MMGLLETSLSDTPQAHREALLIRRGVLGFCECPLGTSTAETPRHPL
jgi:hypothetical protein